MLCSCLVVDFTPPKPNHPFLKASGVLLLCNPPGNSSVAIKWKGMGVGGGRKMTQTQHNTTIECVHTHTPSHTLTHTHTHGWIPYSLIAYSFVVFESRHPHTIFLMFSCQIGNFYWVDTGWFFCWLFLLNCSKLRYFYSSLII